MGRSKTERPIEPCSGRRSRRIAIPTVVGLYLVATVLARRRGYGIGGNTVVRCREGHLFTTLWIPGVKLKALDFGIVRLQHCPVGHHWTLVRPVRDSGLSDEERQFAHAHHDLPIP